MCIMDLIKKLLDEDKTVPPERRAYLLEFFRYIPDETAKHILPAEVKKGQYVLKAGTPCDMVYFLLKGNVTGEAYASRGRAYSFMDFSEMSILGDFELFDPRDEYSLSIRAEQDCSLLKLSMEQYKNWVRQDANALHLRIRNILSVLSFERRIDREYLQKNSKERLIILLARFYERGNKDELGNYTVRHTQAELADKTGVNLRSVQRSIAALEHEQLVELKKGKIVLSREQYEKLRQFAEE